MKIAVNRPTDEQIAKYHEKAWVCWDFNLSAEAIIWLLEKESECLSWVNQCDADYPDDKYYSHIRDDYFVCNFNFKTRILKHGKVYYFEKDYWKDRSHLDLIEVIEKLGNDVNALNIHWPNEEEKAAGDFAGGMASAIVLVEIPDNVFFYIEDEYENGYEVIHEEHRTW